MTTTPQEAPDPGTEPDLEPAQPGEDPGTLTEPDADRPATIS